MKYVATIEARMGSTRLPGKTLRPILGKPMIQWMIERVMESQLIDEIVVATSINPNNDPLEELAVKLGVEVFRGSEDDVLDRVLKAAQKHQADHIIELWGDTPLIDPEIIDQAIKYYADNCYDCVGTCLEKTFPWGISFLIFPKKVLEEVDKLTNDPVDRENVSTYIYHHPEKYRIGHLPCPPEIRRPELRLVVDEMADFDLIARIFDHFSRTKPDFRTKDIIDFLDKNPELKKINPHVKQKVVVRSE